MSSQRNPRPKTKPQMRKLVEEIVLTEEDEKILDEVWKEMRRKLIQKRRMEEARKRRRAAQEIVKLARKNEGLLVSLVTELKKD